VTIYPSRCGELWTRQSRRRGNTNDERKVAGLHVATPTTSARVL